MQEFEFKMAEDGTYAAVAYRGDEKRVVVPESFLGAPVCFLFDKLFRGHGEIEEVVIPKTVTDLGEFVFDGCANLHRLSLPSGLRHLWGHTFVRSGLKEVVLPDGVTRIPSFAFRDCKQLRRVVCGKGMRRVNAWAFSGCDSFEELVCDESVEVSPEAFASKELRSGTSEGLA